METPPINSARIIERLKFFNYKYKEDGNSLRIFLSMRCSLKIIFNEQSVRITSYGDRKSNITLDSLLWVITVGWIFCWIGSVAYVGKPFSIYLMIVPVILFVALVIDLLVTENMKSIVHNWMEKDFMS